MLHSMGSQRVGHDWTTEQQQWLIRDVVQQELTQHCKINYIPIKKKQKIKQHQQPQPQPVSWCTLPTSLAPSLSRLMP